MGGTYFSPLTLESAYKVARIINQYTYIKEGNYQTIYLYFHELKYYNN